MLLYFLYHCISIPLSDFSRMKQPTQTPVKICSLKRIYNPNTTLPCSTAEVADFSTLMPI